MPLLAQSAGGDAFLRLPGLRNLDQAEHWFRHSLSLRPDSDHLGRARNLHSLGAVALYRFQDARAAGAAKPVLLEHLNTALRSFRQAVDLIPADDHEEQGTYQNQLGITYDYAGDTRRALHHFQQAIKHEEARGDLYAAGQTQTSGSTCAQVSDAQPIC